MSLQETPKAPAVVKGRQTSRVDLGGRYRKIGISAVAAAVRFQTTDAKSAGGEASAEKPSAPQKVFDSD